MESQGCSMRAAVIMRNDYPEIIVLLNPGETEDCPKVAAACERVADNCRAIGLTVWGYVHIHVKTVEVFDAD